jgi:hypothetical protein
MQRQNHAGASHERAQKVVGSAEINRFQAAANDRFP